MPDHKHYPHAVITYQGAHRPPEYWDDIAPAKVSEDAAGVTYDRAHPSWLAAKEKYAVHKPLAGVRKLAHGAAGLVKAALNLDPVSDAELERRKGICGPCPHNKGNIIPHCDICKCALAAKLRIASEHCPDNPPRW